MAERFLVRTRAGDHIAHGEKEILDWLKHGHCGCGDFVFIESKQKWICVSELPAIVQLFAEKPSVKLEKPVITIYKLGQGKSIQEGPFTLSTVLSMLNQGELCAYSWIFIDGDKEWRQVRNVKILREALPALPHEPPRFELIQMQPPDTSHLPEDPLGADMQQQQPSIVPMPNGPPDTISLDSHSGAFTATAAAAAIPMFSNPLAEDHDANDTEKSEVSVKIDSGFLQAKVPMPFPPSENEEPDIEEQTKAFSKLGLSQQSLELDRSEKTDPGLNIPAPPKPPPQRPTATPIHTTKASSSRSPINTKEEPFDGITVEIPQNAIWLIKQEKSDRLTGPFSFQQVIDMLKTGRVSKEDKISRQGTHRFNKIAQQFEFNVKYSIETVVEGGVEKQKILIKRRHPRVAYITDVVISKGGKSWHGQCVNISAGGILLEVHDLDVNLGETVEIQIKPGLIPKSIRASTMVIGKISKKPPGYALRFKNLSVEDKEAIEYFVMETLKKEQAIGM